MAEATRAAFFSYSRADSEFALRLAADLKAAGANVWLDQLDIAPGQRWTQAVQDALINCPTMLVVLSPESAESTNVDDEVSFALGEHKRIIPILYRECAIPYRLRPLQFVDFRTDYSNGLKAMLGALGAAAPARSVAAPSALSNETASEDSKREETSERKIAEGEEPRLAAQSSKLPLAHSPWMKVIAIATCGILIVAAMVYWSLSRRHPSEALENTGDSGSTSAALVWAVGWKGTIVHTEDSGGKWTPQSGGASRFYSVAFATPKAGWAVGEEGVIMHTEDGGANWTSQLSGTTRDLVSVAFPTPELGWVVGELGLILHTEDGGHTWNSQTGDANRTLLSVAFANRQCGWAVGFDGIIIHTEDGGATWVRQTSGTENELESITFVTPRSGWAVGHSGTILHTVDGGRNWKTQANPAAGSPLALSSVSFANPHDGWVVGGSMLKNENIILHTKDGGTTWERQNSGTDLFLHSVAFATPLSGWAGGDPGILHTEDGGASWKKQDCATSVSLYGIALARSK